MGGQKLTSAGQILTIGSISGIWRSTGPSGLQAKYSVGNVPSKIVYFLLRSPITLSTWIRTLAIPLVISTSTGSVGQRSSV